MQLMLVPHHHLDLLREFQHRPIEDPYVTLAEPLAID